MRKIRLSLLSLLIIFIGVINVKADVIGPISTSTSRFRYDGTQIVDAQYGEPDAIFSKFAGNNSYICISGVSVEIDTVGTCSYNSAFDRTKSIGAAYIIGKATNNVEGVSKIEDREKYYWLEMVILNYLGQAQNITLTSDVLNTKVKEIFGYTYDELKSGADSYAAKYSGQKYQEEIDIAFEFSDGAKEINFEELEDSYLSQKIYVKDLKGNVELDKIQVGVTSKSKVNVINGTDEKGKFYQLKINKSDIEETSIYMTLMAETSYEYYIASAYDCAGEYQDLMATKTQKVYKEKTISSSKNLIIEPEVKTSKLTIYKKDSKGNYLEGVKIKVESKENNYVKEFLTGKQPLVIEELKFGTYVITEISAPKGYSILKESKTVSLSETKLDEEVTLVNNLNRVEIKKLNAANDSLLEGAVLQIQTEDGKVVEEWKTTKKAYVIEGLEPGTYYLVEKTAPKGFELNKEKIKIEIDETTTVKEVVMKNNLEVEVPDTLSSRSALLIVIAMFDIALGIGILTYVKNRKVEE